MGKVGFGELAFWLVALRRPTPSETRVFEAVLVALADHGFTPTAIAARLTYLSAPDSLQGALAAGLLGGGSRFLGVTEDCGAFLDDVLVEHGTTCPRPTTPAGMPRAGRRSPHPGGRPVRPRARPPGAQGAGPAHAACSSGSPRRRASGGQHLRLFEAIGRVHDEVLGRRLPLNGAGVCGAALADLGLPVELLRGLRPAGPGGRAARAARRGAAPPDRHGRLPDRRPQRGLRRSPTAAD